MLYHYSIDLNQLADQIRTMEVNLLNYERRVKVIQEKARKETQEKAISDYDYLTLWGWNLRSLDWQSLPNSILDFLSPHDFTFLDKFRQDFSNKYMLQVEKDYEGLSPGLILLEELINSIYGITNLDQAQRDRTFQNTVAIVGVGLAAGSMVVSLNKLGEGKNDPVRSVLTHSLKIQPPWLEPAIPLVYSLSTAILAALFTWLVIRLKERSR
ncbi:hypothetical protein [Coleofasciculus sp.]|uniref:hypothetical protein n=1 Tax=Coleofasciculus sp. TaxID=3100458 RepID=UPI0039FA4C2C